MKPNEQSASNLGAPDFEELKRRFDQKIRLVQSSHRGPLPDPAHQCVFVANQLDPVGIIAMTNTLGARHIVQINRKDIEREIGFAEKMINDLDSFTNNPVKFLGMSGHEL